MADCSYQEAKEHYKKGEEYRQQGAPGSAKEEYESALKCLEPLEDDKRSEVHIFNNKVLFGLSLVNQ